MPFKKGEAPPGSGRKGYEYEEAQLLKMRTLLDKYLEVADRILGDEEKPQDQRKIQILSADMRAILSKLHASRVSQEHSGEVTLPKPIVEVKPNAILQDHGDKETPDASE